MIRASSIAGLIGFLSYGAFGQPGHCHDGDTNIRVGALSFFMFIRCDHVEIPSAIAEPEQYFSAQSEKEPIARNQPNS